MGEINCSCVSVEKTGAFYGITLEFSDGANFCIPALYYNCELCSRALGMPREAAVEHVAYESSCYRDPFNNTTDYWE